MHMFSDVRFGLLYGGRNENTEILLHEYLTIKREQSLIHQDGMAIIHPCQAYHPVLMGRDPLVPRPWPSPPSQVQICYNACDQSAQPCTEKRSHGDRTLLARHPPCRPGLVAGQLPAVGCLARLLHRLILRNWSKIGSRFHVYSGTAR
jgi:hypothetical protein